MTIENSLQQNSVQVKPVKSEDERILVLTPTGRDSVMMCQLLSGAGFQCQPGPDVLELCVLMKEGAGAILIADEALNSSATAELLQRLDAQEPWSDVPLIVFPSSGANT